MENLHFFIVLSIVSIDFNIVVVNDSNLLDNFVGYCTLDLFNTNFRAKTAATVKILEGDNLAIRADTCRCKMDFEPANAQRPTT